MNYQEIFDKMLAEIKAVKGTNLIHADFFCKEEIIPSFFKKHKTLKRIEDEIRALNDNKIVWSFTDDYGNLLPMGETHLISIEAVIASKTKLWSGSNTTEEKEVLSELMLFDDHPEAGDGMMGCLRLNNDMYEPWFINENGEFFKMKLDLAGYLIRLSELKAVYGWQYFFIDVDLKKPPFDVVRSDLKKRLTILDSCFPDNSYTNYSKKLK
jgi:hypothetical protein